MTTQILLTIRDPSSGQLTKYANQSFNITAYDGSQATITLDEIQTWRYYSGIACIIYGTTIGLCSALLVAMIAHALIDQTKLRRPIFILNMVNLFLASSRAIVFAIIVSGSFQNLAQEFLGAPASNGNIFEGLVIVGIVFQLLLYMSIIATLGSQVQVVLSAAKGERGQQFLTMILSIVGLVLFVFESAYCVLFIIFVVSEKPVPVWVIIAVRVLFSVFVGICSIVFLYKLGIAIRQRRRIGIAKFGPLQILFIMSCQCLIVPRKSTFSVKLTLVVIFYILSDTVMPFNNMVLIGQAVLVCSLPLSTLWASSSESVEHNSLPSTTINVRGDSQTREKGSFLHDPQ